ncbi:hypothetical protein [Reyranella sp. CPCC 100927]|uniref:hypothetical protein n=1 Tax=Reyranella sp. CPCC 100927 TaxID=2599616 RepID=UPI0011B4C409|nr:hypothetical protein [Reyranella sp. CPCC 100927]TWT01166.1 hypothetical protein FQU96_32285 [Reyranella sp. CPCC 100927]
MLLLSLGVNIGVGAAWAQRWVMRDSPGEGQRVDLPVAADAVADDPRTIDMPAWRQAFDRDDQVMGALVLLSGTLLFQMLCTGTRGRDGAGDACITSPARRVIP